MKHFLIKLKWFFKLLFGLYYDAEVIVDDFGKRIPIVIILINSHKSIRNYNSVGLCDAIKSNLNKSGYFPNTSQIIKENIKLFNNDVASTYFFATPTENSKDYWWTPRDKKIRLKYLDWLIDAYK